MRCVSRVEVEPQEACLSNLLRTSFADRARMIIIIIIVSRAVGSGKRRETQERNEKKTKKIFFFTLDTKQGRIELVTARVRSSSISGLRPLKPSPAT
jgi:hypothetical protein